MNDETNTVITTKPNSISFDGCLRLGFDRDGLLVVSVANSQYVMMPEETNELRDWLLADDHCVSSGSRQPRREQTVALSFWSD